MSCKVCRMRLPDGSAHPTALVRRATWGCDEPTSHGKFRVLCESCHGLGGECCGFGENGGDVAYTRCPNAVALPACAPALGFVLANLESTRLPCAGGLLDQTAAFVDTLAIVESERGRIAEEHRKRSGTKDLDPGG